MVREIEFLKGGIEVGILSERRAFEPYGMKGGHNAKRGKNFIIFKDRTVNFGGKNSIVLADKGARVRIETPGGGGYGKAKEEI